MARSILTAALATGAFCSIFAVFVDLVTEALTVWQVMAAGGISGVLGSLFASLVLGRER